MLRLSGKSAAVFLALLSNLQRNHAQEELVCTNEAQVGHCLFKGCFMGHGFGVHCHSFRCLCDPGFCAVDGSYCERAASTTTILEETTTDVFGKFDICGMREYTDRGPFKRQVAMCAFTECSRLWREPEKAKCCAFQCSAKTLKEDKPECWPAIAGALRHEWDANSIAQQMGTKGSIAGNVLPKACDIPDVIGKVVSNLPGGGGGGDGADFLGPEALAVSQQAYQSPSTDLVKEILRFSESTAALAIQSGRETEHEASYYVVSFTACIVAVIAVVAAVHISRRRTIQQQPLLA